MCAKNFIFCSLFFFCPFRACLYFAFMLSSMAKIYIPILHFFPYRFVESMINYRTIIIVTRSVTFTIENRVDCGRSLDLNFICIQDGVSIAHRRKYFFSLLFRAMHSIFTDFSVLINELAARAHTL